MRTAKINAVLAVAVLSLAAVGCRGRSAMPSAARALAADGAAGSSAEPLEAGPAGAAAADAGADAAADAGADEGIAWGEYFSLTQQRGDVLHAYDESYERMPTAPLASLDDAVVLCRVALVEPAPLPTSKWDRVNGRDLQLEISGEDGLIVRAEGALGHPDFHVRADDAMRLARSGAPVKWVLRDRDQQHAYPYEHGVVVGTFDAPRDVTIPLHAVRPGLRIDCRGAPLAEAVRLLLPEADRALAEAETKATWGPADPRGTFMLRQDLGHAADRLRIGMVIAASVNMTEEWSRREERLRAIVRRYMAVARAAYDRLEPAPVGVWVPVGPTLSVRTAERVCPAIPEGVDPGSVNDEPRGACGLVLELRSATKLRFDPNPWGPAYACRITGPIRLASLDGPGSLADVCPLGVRRGARWLKHGVQLSPTEPTAMVLAGTSFGRALRVSVGDASVLLAVPPGPAASPSPPP